MADLTLSILFAALAFAKPNDENNNAVIIFPSVLAFFIFLPFQTYLKYLVIDLIGLDIMTSH